MNALYSNTQGMGNTANGNNALYNSTNGNQNTATGFYALFYNTSGDINTAVGNNALYVNDNGFANTAIGGSSLNNNTTGGYNTASGAMALSSNITGLNNTAIGYAADVLTGNLSNATAIGNGAKVTASNQVRIGNAAISSLYFGTADNLAITTDSVPNMYYDYTTGQIMRSTVSAGGGNPNNYWKILGNTGTSVASNFIGTTDQQPLMIKVNNEKSGYIDWDVARANTGMGFQILNSNTVGYRNTANGYRALYSNTTGFNNTATGYKALYSTTLSNGNTALGFGAGDNNVNNGNNNTFIGNNAAANANGYNNSTALGSNALVAASNVVILGDNNVNVGIGLSGLIPGNKLEIKANAINSSGLRFTNLTSTSPTVAPNPGNGVLAVNANGDVVYVTAPTGGGTGNFWDILGNGGTISDANFIGTTTNIPFNIRVNNEKAGRIDPILFNTFFGYKSGNAIPTGKWNTAFGNIALQNNTTGQDNTAIGDQALTFNSTGISNTATGKAALYSNTTGNNNTAIGYIALNSNTTGLSNTAIGMSTLFNNTDGGYNTVIGATALYSNTTGSMNTANGTSALFQNTLGSNNSANGYQALINNTSGNYNTANGKSALSTNITGSNNTALGYNANVLTGALSNASALGANAVVALSNSMILGNNSVNVGIGLSGNTSGPGNKLEINSDLANASGLRFRQLTSASPAIAPNPGTGVLSVDANGDVIYVAVSGGAVGPDSWTTFGNNGINASSNFLGTINNADLVIKTNNIEKMRVMADGNVGIGTPTPEFKLSLDNDGGILSKGVFANGVILNTAGAGTRMLWYPRKAAFRAGNVSGASWDDANIGIYSFATGSDSKASGEYSSALGGLTTASGDASTAMGYQSTSSGIASTSMGYQTTAAGAYSVAAGYQTNAVGYFSIAIGKNATASVANAMALGYNVNADAAYATAMGFTTIASGNSSTAMGTNTTASGDYTTAMGSNASTNSKVGSFVLGDHAGTTQLNSSVINEFSTRFAGGYRLYSNSTLTAGVILAPGAGAWANVSDKTKKENFLSLQAEEVLLKIKNIPITQWNYKAQNETIHHIGPMAQDFYLQFKLGEFGNDTTITTSDIDGINMLGIQALENRTSELNSKIIELQTTVNQQQIKVASLESQLNVAIESLKKMDALNDRLNKLEHASATVSTYNK
jgi:uncharacterized coiled-coil protein SlyX